MLFASLAITVVTVIVAVVSIVIAVVVVYAVFAVFAVTVTVVVVVAVVDVVVVVAVVVGVVVVTAEAEQDAMSERLPLSAVLLLETSCSETFTQTPDFCLASSRSSIRVPPHETTFLNQKLIL